MKFLKSTLIVLLVASTPALSQQSYSLSEIHYRIDPVATLNAKYPAGVPPLLLSLANAYAANPPNFGVFGLEGIGSLSTEELTKANGSGKISFIVNPNPIFYANGRSLQSFLHISLNKNATNNTDSLLPSTILFPELGNTSFNGTYEILWKFQKKCEETQYYVSAFFDFAVKDIKTILADTTYHFNTLSYSLGFRFLLQHYYLANNTIRNANMSITPYVNMVNIPDEDIMDYNKLIGDQGAPDPLWGVGVKVTAQFSNFIFFADLRHTFYDDAHPISNRDLKGFSSNIGVGITGELFRF